MYLEPLYIIDLAPGPRGPMQAILDEAGMWVRYAGNWIPVRGTLWFGNIPPPLYRLLEDTRDVAEDLRRGD